MGRRGARRSIVWGLMGVAFAGSGQLLAAAPASAGGTCHSSATAGRGETVVIDQLCFGPTVLYARPGATVTWDNKDSVEHTVTGLGFRWGSDSGLAQSSIYAHTFSTAGVYPYSCTIHPGMVGAVVVGNAGSPAAAGAVPAIAPPAAAPPTTAAPAVAPVAATQPQSASSSPWLAVTLAALGILLAGATVITVQRQQARHRGAASA